MALEWGETSIISNEGKTDKSENWVSSVISLCII